MFFLLCSVTTRASNWLTTSTTSQASLSLEGPYLLVYGAYIFTQRKKEDKKIHVEESSTNYIGLFIKGFALNIINIAVLLFWAGVILVVVPNLNKTNSLGVFTFFTTILGSYFLTDVLKIFIAKKLTSKINTENTAIIKTILSLILVISGAVIIAKGAL